MAARGKAPERSTSSAAGATTSATMAARSSRWDTDMERALLASKGLTGTAARAPERRLTGGVGGMRPESPDRATTEARSATVHGASPLSRVDPTARPTEPGSRSGVCPRLCGTSSVGRPALPNWGHKTAYAAVVWHQFGRGYRTQPNWGHRTAYPAVVWHRFGRGDRPHRTGVTERRMPRLCGTGSVAGARPSELGSRSGVCRGCVAPVRWRGPAQPNWGHGTAYAAVLWHQVRWRGGRPGPCPPPTKRSPRG